MRRRRGEDGDEGDHGEEDEEWKTIIEMRQTKTNNLYAFVFIMLLVSIWTML